MEEIRRERKVKSENVKGKKEKIKNKERLGENLEVMKSEQLGKCEIFKHQNNDSD